jgi:hypothetical protein
MQCLSSGCCSKDFMPISLLRVARIQHLDPRGRPDNVGSVRQFADDAVDVAVADDAETSRSHGRLQRARRKAGATADAARARKRAVCERTLVCAAQAAAV